MASIGVLLLRPNADLKQAMGKRVPVRTKAKLREAASEHMAMLEKSPELVMSYLQEPRVKYAAAQDFIGPDQ